MRKINNSFKIGIIISVLAVAAALLKFRYWYMFFVIGAFMFWGSLNYNHRNDTVYKYIVKKKYLEFFIIYTIGVSVAFISNVVFGRILANLWSYNMPTVLSYIFPVFIHYPVAGLAIYEMYYFLRDRLQHYFEDKGHLEINESTKYFFAHVLLMFGVTGLIFPLINVIINSNSYAAELIIIIMILTIFSADALNYILDGESILLDIAEANYLVLITSLVTLLLSALLSEIPNLFAQAWVYNTLPFTSYDFFGVNILIWIFGWPWIVFGSVRIIDIIRIKLEKTIF